jgi:DNA-binding NtrC family response regulator
MQLVADRFVTLDRNGERAFDLATGAQVILVVGSAGGVSEQLRWVDRCDGLRALHHRSIAPLVDFGLVGETSRFEAWVGGPVWDGAAEVAASLCDSVKAYLAAAGLSPGALAPASVRTSSEGAAVLLPDAGTGYPVSSDGRAAAMPLTARALASIDRPGLDALAEMLDAVATRPHVASLWGPRGSGKRTAVGEIARVARLRGFVPIGARLVGSRCAELWRGRSLLVIGADGDDRSWPAFLDASIGEAQPHALLIVGEQECRTIDGVRLGRIPAGALVSAIRPGPLAPALAAAAARYAERAMGLPGRFAELLWRQRAEPGASVRPPVRGRRVAEHSPRYGTENSGDDVLIAKLPVGVCSWPAPGELATLRRRRDAAVADLGRGRHVPGLRQLRQAIGGLARRGDWGGAAEGTLALASPLLRRGRARDALAAIDEGRQYARRAGDDATLLDLAVLSGEAWIDLARPDEAERVLGSAAAAARAAGDTARAASASLTLARGLFWRGSYTEAGALLDGVAEHLRGAQRVRHRLLAARVAVGLRDVSRAMALALEAREIATSEGAGSTIAAVHSTSALVHLAVRNPDAAEHEAAESIAAARVCRDPQRSLRARLLRAEADRRRGRHAAAAAALQRLRRVMAAMPPVLRTRWELASALASQDGDPHETVARFVAATGLGGMALYGSGTAGSSGSPRVADPFVDEVVAILHVCQAAEDEAEVLKQVCARVRQHLRAASVAFAAIRDGRAEMVRADGARIDPGVAERAAAAGVTIAPHRCDDRIEAAAPVQYGGATIGVLCARWTLGSIDDRSRAAPVLTMSAAAAAPMLAAAIARRDEAPAGRDSSLLGVNSGMIELRKAVECAAAAPYAVLIDGESGSGKELVARAIHRGGPRRNRAFCTLNCAALPDDLVEAELFGHTRGAFTGAVGERAGVFEEAHGGTLFLDEIGELAPRAQAKVLRVIQEGELRRVGENISRRVDVRIVAATNRDLRREVEAGRFRLDLLYRLDVVHITVPPLRERREDIVVLAEHFWREATARVGSRAALGAATIAALARYDWPGNVRELQNVLAALAVRSPRRGVIPPSALPAPFGAPAGADPSKLDDARRTFEERFVRAALVRTGGHRGRAAAELGVTRQGLTKLMTRLGISQ